MTAPSRGPDAEAIDARTNEALGRSEAALLQGDLETMHEALGQGLDALALLTTLGHRPHKERPAEPPWDEAAVTQALWLVLAQLKRAGCSVFPFAGTLLGLERDGKLLANDKDADLACGCSRA